MLLLLVLLSPPEDLRLFKCSTERNASPSFGNRTDSQYLSIASPSGSGGIWISQMRKDEINIELQGTNEAFQIKQSIFYVAEAWGFRSRGARTAYLDAKHFAYEGAQYGTLNVVREDEPSTAERYQNCHRNEGSFSRGLLLSDLFLFCWPVQCICAPGFSDAVLTLQQCQSSENRHHRNKRLSWRTLTCGHETHAVCNSDSKCRSYSVLELKRLLHGPHQYWMVLPDFLSGGINNMLSIPAPPEFPEPPDPSPSRTCLPGTHFPLVCPGANLLIISCAITCEVLMTVWFVRDGFHFPPVKCGGGAAVSVVTAELLGHSSSNKLHSPERYSSACADDEEVLVHEGGEPLII
ncbi:hypothetical protein C0J52_11602 [Blattella germanica]|nr:hypothetical protein C0J52_11602 [Blattella germanica]